MNAKRWNAKLKKSKVVLACHPCGSPVIAHEGVAAPFQVVASRCVFPLQAPSHGRGSAPPATA